MSDGFAINTARLRGSGQEFQRLGEQLGGGQGELNARLAGSPGVWGADEEGAAFAGQYQEITAKVQELITAMTEAFDAVGTNPGSER
jgi:hypothetical protein